MEKADMAMWSSVLVRVISFIVTQTESKGEIINQKAVQTGQALGGGSQYRGHNLEHECNHFPHHYRN